jgi:hypothetical protein
MTGWQHAPGHVWEYDTEEVPFGMVVNFKDNEEANPTGLCNCECGICEPHHPHRLEDGCACALLGCACMTPAQMT